MLTTFGHLPSREALSLFYTISLLLALGTLAYLLYAYSASRRSVSSSPAPAISATVPARDWLIHGLGALWLLDGLLQAQPLMVTRFLGGVVAPLISGQPAPVAWLIGVGMRLWSLSPILWNVVAEFTQIGIGLGLLFGRPDRGQRVALWVSLLWGTIVWIGGEGLGGIFAGGGWLTGAPGSVFLYMCAALLLLGPRQWWEGGRPRHILRRFLVGLWLLLLVLQAWPPAGWWTGTVLGGYVLSMASMPQPALFSAPLYAWAHSLALHPVIWNALLCASLAILAVLWVTRPDSRWVWWATLLWVFLGWWLGQDFGVLGGMGTDPNSGAILLLGLVVYGDLAGVIALPRWHWFKRPAPSSPS
ncbi:MAG: hypothetical protein OWU84_00890 [Firmicutes bacterium]|nr:hypothetical protein [Bacillota bacterium]